ncbi:Protein phosphatase 2C-like protein [Smittium culicis]|uniref:Protein phosphatase 2C-like protein n=1 Tax=Smittium culicis TaxID=133412 RepID=A0A1R1XUN7_9FUNG|nr:Protein phosphatase 2C-like protein [Smittium culicis]
MISHLLNSKHIISSFFLKIPIPCKITLSRNHTIADHGLSLNNSLRKFSSPALSPAKEPQKVPLFPSYVAYTEEGTVRVDVRKSPQLIGIKSSRGVRPVNQDRAMFRPVRIPGMVADRRDKGSAQAMFFGIFDGHGGENCSQFLKDNLFNEIETIKNQDLFYIINGYRQMGDAWKDYTPEYLKNMVDIYSKDKILHSFLTLDERLTLSYIKTDLAISQFNWSEREGSTACSAVIWDSEGLPFWSKDSNIQLTVANCGDCRAILCNTTDGGFAQPLSNSHRPSLHKEKSRLEKYGAIFSIDSYGEERAMSMVANTRAFGDWVVKPFGIIAEPEITSVSISGADAAFLVMASDGITDVLTDQEIVDLAKGCPTAEKAANLIYEAAEMLNSQDNMTVIVVRLAGWDSPDLIDLTGSFRKDRIKNSEEMKKFRGSLLTNIEKLENEYKEILCSSKSSLDSDPKPTALVPPDKLLYKIFSHKSNINKPFVNSTNLKPPIFKPHSPSSQDLNKLSVRVIEQRLTALNAILTLKLDGEEINIPNTGLTSPNSDEESDILPIDQAMKMSLKVLGKLEKTQPPPSKHKPKSEIQPTSQIDLSKVESSFSNARIKYKSSNSFRSKSANLKYNILLSLDELKHAWKLLGISSVEYSSKN